MGKISLALMLLAAQAESSWAVGKESRSFHDCSKNPQFIQKVGMQQPVAIDTRQSRFPGVVFKELRGAKRIYRHPSWQLSGHVGSTVRDEFGNVYVVPVPSIGLDTNPLANRNTVFKIDSVTGLMSKFIELPTSDATSQSNPFGTMGLALDCDTRSLYVSSVANSAIDRVNGTIYQIDYTQAKIVSQLNGIDGIGLAVFDPGQGKRLFYGDARSSSMYSVSLLENGRFETNTNPRHELSLLGIKNGDSTQIKKIQFRPDKQYGYKLIVNDTEFAFRLLAHSGRRFRHYEFVQGESAAEWEFLNVR